MPSINNAVCIGPMQEWSAERREEEAWVGVEVEGWGGLVLDRQEQQGLNPSTHTSPHHSAPLNATRRHGEAHLLVLYHSALLKENYCS